MVQDKNVSPAVFLVWGSALDPALSILFSRLPFCSTILQEKGSHPHRNTIQSVECEDGRHKTEKDTRLISRSAAAVEEQNASEVFTGSPRWEFSTQGEGRHFVRNAVVRNKDQLLVSEQHSVMKGLEREVRGLPCVVTLSMMRASGGMGRSFASAKRNSS